MKQLFITFAIILMIFTACSEQETLTNTTVQNNTINTAEPVEEDYYQEDLPEEEPEEIDSPQEIDQVEEQQFSKFKVDKDSRYVINGINLYSETYTEDQEHELRLFINQPESIISAQLSYLPACQKETQEIVVRINDHLILDKSPNCQETEQVVILPEYLEKGANVIEFQAYADEDYAVEDIMITFNYSDGSVEKLPGELFIIEKSEQEHKPIKELDAIVMETVFERTFKINKKELASDIHMDFRLPREKAYLKVVLNNYLIYDQFVEEKNTQVVLPEQLIQDGSNTLYFIIEP